MLKISTKEFSKLNQPYRLEGKLDEQVCRKLRSLGLRYLKQGRGSNPGYPDLMVMVGKSVHVWIELKAEEGVLTAQQKIFFQKLRENGDKVFVCKTIWQVLQAVQDVCTENGIRFPLLREKE